MTEQKPQKVYNVPVWGIFLLFLGVLFLLQTLDVLPWSLWGTLWRFWSVLIIAAGIGILLRRFNPWLTGILILILFLACLGIAIWQYGPLSLERQGVRSYSEPLDSVKNAQMEVDFAAGKLFLGNLAPESLNLVEAVSKSRSGEEDIRVDYYRQNDTGILTLSTDHVKQQFREGADWEVKFTGNIPLTVDIDSAVGDVTLDLSSLDVTELHMDVDVGNYTVLMPSARGTTRAYIKADVANIEITIPVGVAARIRSEVNLTAFEVDEGRFPKKDSYYVSEDFDSAGSRIDLELNCNLGRIQVK